MTGPTVNAPQQNRYNNLASAKARPGSSDNGSDPGQPSLTGDSRAAAGAGAVDRRTTSSGR